MITNNSNNNSNSNNNKSTLAPIKRYKYKEKFTPIEQTILRNHWTLPEDYYRKLDFEKRFISSIDSFLERVLVHPNKPWQDLFVPTNYEVGDLYSKEEKENCYQITYVNSSLDFISNLSNLSNLSEDTKNTKNTKIKLFIYMRVNFFNTFYHVLIRPVDTTSENLGLQERIKKARMFPLSHEHISNCDISNNSKDK